MAGKLETFISVKHSILPHAVIHILCQLLAKKLLTVCGCNIEDCEEHKVVQSCSHYHTQLSI